MSQKDKKDKKAEKIDETKSAEAKEKEKQEKKKAEEKKKFTTVLLELKSDLVGLEKAISTKDNQSIVKITKGIKRYKKYLKSYHLEKIWTILGLQKPYNFEFKQFSDYKENFAENFDVNKTVLAKLQKTVEIEYFMLTLFVIYLINIKKFENKNEILGIINKLITDLTELNKRYLDQLKSVVYFYFSRMYEIQGNLKDIRDTLFDAYRSCCLVMDEYGQATLINLILRNYLTYNQYEAAQQLIQKTTFPENRSINEFVRYLYYNGKIKAIQLQYQESYSLLMHAIRKSPDNTALGFKIQAHKLALVVELLLGQIPARNLFSQKDIGKHLFAYYKIVQSVIKGNVQDFRNALTKYENQFIKDGLLSLVQRLHHNVIKTGLKRIYLSYSKISLKDIIQKLQLDQSTDIEFIVAKAIKDGVFNAKIDHENQCVIIKQNKDLYQSSEPQITFQQRIDYCLNLYNASKKALQYPHVKNAYQERDDNDDVDPEDIMKLVEEEDF